MARIDVIMPQMGESITEGTMSKWLKKIGDPIKRDEPIFEISTDKVDAEIPATTAGVLAEVLVNEGQTVAVGTVVARLETDAGAAVAAAPAAAPPAPAPAAAAPTPAAAAPAPAAAAPAPTAAQTPAPQPPAAPAAKVPATAVAPAAKPAAAPAAPSAPPSGDESAEERLKRKSTPLVRKMAEEHGLDISTIAGTGSAGRVTKSDVIGFIEGGATPAAPVSPAAQAPVPAASPVPATPVGPAAAMPAAAIVEAWAGDRVEPWSRIRKLTAAHMVMSRRVSAHVNSLMEIDYTHVSNIRKQLKANYAERGVNLTYLAFVVKAIASNLRKHPVLNAAVSGDNTIYRGDINIGIAVALDWGLIVPVIRNADDLSLLGVARAVQDLADRARNKRLTPEDVQKGTFTITNPGGFGTWVGTPVINQPQAAILAVGAIEKRPSVVTLPDGSDALGIRTQGMWCLAYDHRIVDGADADRFLADVRKSMHEFPEDSQG